MFFLGNFNLLFEYFIFYQDHSDDQNQSFHQIIQHLMAKINIL